MPDTRMWRILNVDDNEAGRYATTRILKNAGFDVIEAAKGADALALATDQHPDFVLLDVNLPDISGLEVARRLKQNTKTASIPVVHLSAVFINSKDRVQGLEGGADGYLVHPIEPEELVATIRSFLRIRKAEMALQESEEKFRTLAESTPVAIMIYQGDNWVYSNLAGELMSGYSSEELYSMRYWDFVAPEFRQLVRERGKQRQAGEHPPGSYDFRIITKEGTEKWVSLTGNQFRFKGEPAGLISVIDITGRKQVEEALKESEERYRTLFEWMDEGFCVIEMLYDPDGKATDYRFLEINRAFEKQTGLQQAQGKTIREMVPNHDSHWFEIYGNVAQTGESIRFENPAVAMQRYYDVFAFRVGGEKSRKVGVFFNDITERKRAEEQIKISETRYRRLFESAKDGILILNRETSEIIDANPFIKSLTGYAKEELIGKKLWDIGFFNDQLASKIAFGELQTNDYIRYEDLPLETKDGKMIEVEFISNIYLIDQNQSVVQCNIRDITDRKAIEHQREALIRELAQKNAELERFTYTVSHELKSPLITIKVFAGHIDDDARKGDLPQLKNDIDRINAAAGTMLALLSDLLDLARVGRITKIPEKIPFGTIAHEAAGLLAVPLNERHVTVKIAPDLPDVYVDHARIREAMVNLIENTIKFFGEQTDPITWIGMDMRGEIPVFFVKDNGIGVDQRYLERIFNLFEKLDASVDGTGIGLAIVRRIIEEHGGKIWAESDGPGKGTTFRFTLPGVSGDGDVPVPEVI